LLASTARTPAILIELEKNALREIKRRHEAHGVPSSIARGVVVRSFVRHAAEWTSRRPSVSPARERGVSMKRAMGHHGEHEQHAAHGAHAPTRDADAGAAVPGHGSEEPAGLGPEKAGYALELTRTDAELSFVIRAPDGKALDRFARVHDRELHLFVVSRDLTRYSHLHPTRDARGTWSVSLPPLEPGPYWVYADFTVDDGPALTLRQDLSIPGTKPERARPAPSASAHVEGFHVELEGVLRAETPAKLAFRVRGDGGPVPLEPYLGARGHLVVIRADDGAFLHVHPLEERAATGDVSFNVHPPSAGRYELFLDFQVEGRVHTATFSVEVGKGRA
jgi:hypothetical protein